MKFRNAERTPSHADLRKDLKRFIQEVSSQRPTRYKQLWHILAPSGYSLHLWSWGRWWIRVMQGRPFSRKTRRLYKSALSKLHIFSFVYQPQWIHGSWGWTRKHYLRPCRWVLCKNWCRSAFSFIDTVSLLCRTKDFFALAHSILRRRGFIVNHFRRAKQRGRISIYSTSNAILEQFL